MNGNGLEGLFAPTKKHVKAIGEMMTRAFVDYPIYKVYFSDRGKREVLITPVF